jgi:hypothetical protein
VNQIVPAGTRGKAIPLRVSILPSRRSRKVVKQIGTPRSPYPIMRRPRVDREEKRVTHGNETEKRVTHGNETDGKRAEGKRGKKENRAA